jgi:hypothetical protein
MELGPGSKSVKEAKAPTVFPASLNDTYMQ